MPRNSRRTSLSDWWRKHDHGHASASTADGSDQEDAGTFELEEEVIEIDNKSDRGSESPRKQRRFSPRKTECPNFCIGDDSDAGSVAPSMAPSASHSLEFNVECSPRKRTVAAADDGNVSTVMMSILRRICSQYFENNVSPVLKFVQQTQEQLMTQVKDLSAKLDRKANNEDVVPLAEIENVASRVAKSRADDSKVALHARVEEIAKWVQNQKAQAERVPSKANHKDAVTAAQLAELAAVVERKANKEDIATAQVADQGELQTRLREAEQKVISLSEELQELKAADTSGSSSQSAEIAKVKAIFVAGGTQMDKKIKDMQKQIKILTDQRLGKDDIGERWPGRKLPCSGPGDNDSDNESDRHSVDRLSLCSSAKGSTISDLDPEAKAELNKMKAIMSAASQVFAKDIKGIKNDLRELRTELAAVKTSLGTKR